jgi:hypothetical protein
MLGNRSREGQTGHEESRLGQLLARGHSNIAACALANKNARIVWALLVHNRAYQCAYPAARTA